MSFYAIYPPSAAASSSVQTVQGEGTPGTPIGGILTVQGDPSGTPLPVTGSITATNPSVAPTGAAVPADATYAGMDVGGNLTGLTGTANGLKVDGSAVNQPTVFTDSTATGSITSTQSVSIATIGYATVGIQVTGTWTGTLFLEWSPDNSNWYNTTWASIQSGALSLTFTTNGAGTVQCSGAAAIRIRGGSVATGTAVIYLRANATPAQLMLDNPLPAGSNTIGAVNQASGPWTQNITQFGGNPVVTGTGIGGNGIPRVTVSSDSTIGITAGTAIIGKVSIDQTTPGVTNGVQVNAALPAGSNSIGDIGTVTTVITVGAVTAISNALPAGTNLLGKVGIDQTTPGTTNAIQATSATTIAWQAEGNIAFGSLTNAYQTIFTPSANTKILFMRNNTNAAVSFSMDAGTTTNFILDSGDQVAIDFVSNGVISTTTAIQVKYTVGAPTSGSVRVNGGH